MKYKRNLELYYTKYWELIYYILIAEYRWNCSENPVVDSSVCHYLDCVLAARYRQYWTQYCAASSNVVHIHRAYSVDVPVPRHYVNYENVSTLLALQRAKNYYQHQLLYWRHYWKISSEVFPNRYSVVRPSANGWPPRIQAG